jgi:hypothetical protein
MLGYMDRAFGGPKNSQKLPSVAISGSVSGGNPGGKPESG